MQSILGTTAKLADDDWFVIRNVPLHFRCVVDVTIPTNILIETNHIDILMHIVLQTILEV